MPKFRFQAVDQTGRVVRGVLRAESVVQAREILMDESHYAKTLLEVPEEEKITWSPRARIKAAAAASSAASAEPARIIRAAFATRCVSGLEGIVAGEAGLGDDDRFIFRPVSGEALVVDADQIETAAIAGLPRKRLAIVLVTGKSYEFEAGFFSANSAAKLVTQTFGKAR